MEYNQWQVLFWAVLSICTWPHIMMRRIRNKVGVEGDDLMSPFWPYQLWMLPRVSLANIPRLLQHFKKQRTWSLQVALSAQNTKLSPFSCQPWWQTFDSTPKRVKLGCSICFSAWCCFCLPCSKMKGSWSWLQTESAPQPRLGFRTLLALGAEWLLQHVLQKGLLMVCQITSSLIKLWH